MKFWKIILSTVLAVALFGCSSKYQAPQNINTTLTETTTKAQVKRAILASATPGKAAAGMWKMVETNNSTIQGRLFNRGYEVVVDIPYTANGYSINYSSASSNLKDKNGNIHRNYNRWINNLDAKIKQNIFIQK